MPGGARAVRRAGCTRVNRPLMLFGGGSFQHGNFYPCLTAGVRGLAGACGRHESLNKDTWLILPVVICLSQRLSHACLSISNLYGETANGSLNQLSFI